LVAHVPLAAGVHAVVDASDLALVGRHGWSLDPTSRYAVAYIDPRDSRRCIRMHRLITEARSDQVVDHINGDGLDNRRENLRVCTQAENCRNRRKFGGWTSRYKGVSLARGGGRSHGGRRSGTARRSDVSATLRRRKKPPEHMMPQPLTSSDASLD
jgi:hypothetical protein